MVSAIDKLIHIPGSPTAMPGLLGRIVNAAPIAHKNVVPDPNPTTRYPTANIVTTE